MTSTAQQSQYIPSRRRFTVEEYYRLAAIGLLHEDDRIELIDGELIELEAISPLHAEIVRTLTELADSSVRKEARLSVQNPIHLGPRTEPQPDVALTRRKRYTVSHPTPDDIYLVIEVADTSISYDRVIKVPIYAQAGITCVSPTLFC